jgi:hypothetical protein
MNGFENLAYLIGYIISNLVALFVLFLAWRWERIARIALTVIFAWACWVNWHTALQSPEDYLRYADLALLHVYKSFILGWFSGNVTWVVASIATCQGLIAIAFLLRGWMFKAGAFGAILFLLAIMPLGVGSGFPCTLVLAIAIAMLIYRNHDYVWSGTVRSGQWAVRSE